MRRRRHPLEHAAAMVALVVTFLAITAGIGTVAAVVPVAAMRPTATPSVGLANLPPAGAGRRPGVKVAGSDSGPRPGLTAHVSPGPPLTYAFSPDPLTPVPNHGMRAGVLVDLDSHRVLWYTNPSQPRATASLAKVFTVMVAMDHAGSLDEVLTVPPGGEDDNPEHSVMGLVVGDRVSVRTLVEGVWLASGDDAAETLARTLVPRDRFIAEMNDKAAWLGLADTHFSNPSGLDQDGEVSSAYDLAVASGWLWTHYPEAFALASQKYVPLVVRGRDLSLRSLNKMVAGMPPDSKKPYPGANGLKTGDTPNAGGCVIATAQRGGKRLIAVVMGDDWFFSDAGSLLDYGFAVDH